MLELHSSIVDECKTDERFPNYIETSSGAPRVFTALNSCWHLEQKSRTKCLHKSRHEETVNF
jgi:hypothetical protein